MMKKKLEKLLNRSKFEPYVGVDIGTSAIKILSLDLTTTPPTVLCAGITPTPAGAISNNLVVKPEQIGAAIRAVLDANEITAHKAAFVIPGTSAFTKKITVPFSGLAELAESIPFEAGNYIPHSLDAVHLDFQVLRRTSKSSVEVLLVAVKNETIQSYLKAIEEAGLQPTVGDVDYFALENMFATACPEQLDKTVALVNVGSRYTSVSIIQKGESLFVGDVGVGGRLYTDTICEATGMDAAAAEQVKAGTVPDWMDKQLIEETRDRTTEHIAGELQRQIGFFWNAAAAEGSIETIFVCGGSAVIPGLIEELGSRTGIPCSGLDVFRGVASSENIDQAFITEVGLGMGACLGVALRRTGDKVHSV